MNVWPHAISMPLYLGLLLGIIVFFQKALSTVRLLLARFVIDHPTMDDGEC